MSMRSTPSSTARRSTAIAASWSAGGPQIPGPVIRIAPKPSRCTVLPASSKVPDACTGFATVLLSMPCASGRRASGWAAG